MALPTALIGYTGFVGSNLARQSAFDDQYNSRNIGEIAGKHYSLVVCAGVPAEKWRANKEPERDRATIASLTDALSGARADRVVLISTVDVYPSPVDVDEDTPIDHHAAQPYGRHRRELELWVAERFDTMIVRLPGLFGRGLKKNAIYDFLHDNRVDQIHSEGVFQFYDLEHIWRDVGIAAGAGLALVNFATEPTSVREVAAFAFDRDFRNAPAPSAARYDVRSRHAALFGGRDGYLYDRRAVLDGIRRFVAGARVASP